MLNKYRLGYHPSALMIDGVSCISGRKRSAFWRAEAAVRFPFFLFSFFILIFSSFFLACFGSCFCLGFYSVFVGIRFRYSKCFSLFSVRLRLSCSTFRLLFLLPSHPSPGSVCCIWWTQVNQLRCLFTFRQPIGPFVYICDQPIRVCDCIRVTKTSSELDIMSTHVYVYRPRHLYPHEKYDHIQWRNSSKMKRMKKKKKR